MRGKLEESFDRRHEKLVELGHANAEHIRRATAWCKHIRIEMVSAGMLAHFSGLPIGSHSVTCPNVKGGLQSMNLPWILPDFIAENCEGCAHHEHNGDLSWGNEVLEGRRQAKHAREVEAQNRARQLQELRARLRELPQKARGTEGVTKQQVLGFVESLFSDNADEREKASTLLVQSAKIGADLFPPVATNVLIEQGQYEEFAAYCMPVCAELGRHRDDLSGALEAMACAAIKKKVVPEITAGILVALGDAVKYPLDTQTIAILISHQDHSLGIGRRNSGSQEFPNNTAVLVRCYDKEATSVVKPFQELLARDEKLVRVNACGALAQVQEARPQIGLDLLADLVSSLELPDDIYEDSADARAREQIADAFRYRPEEVDSFLHKELRARRCAVQQEIVSVYRSLIGRDRRARGEELSDASIADRATLIAISRLVDLAKDASLDIEVRREVGEALERACEEYPQEAMPHFEALFGQFALMCSEDVPPAKPRIVIPGQEPRGEVLERLEDNNRRQHWQFAKDKMLDCLKAIAKKRPRETVPILLACFEELDSKTHKELKSSVVELLGEAGQDYGARPQVLPVLFRGLMDTQSQVMRATAVRATEEAYRFSAATPPNNMVDAISLLLGDSYVIVHTAATKVLGWNSDWLTPKQAVETISRLANLLAAHRKDPFSLKDICEAILRIGNRFVFLQQLALRLVTSVFPTDQDLVDDSIAKEITFIVDPGSPAASEALRCVLWCLSKHERDHYNDYSHSERQELFDWLHALPRAAYLRERDSILESARELARKDAWESCHFASVFAHYGDFLAEKELLEAVAESLPAERRHDEFREELQRLAAGANANARCRAAFTCETHDPDGEDGAR